MFNFTGHTLRGAWRLKGISFPKHPTRETPVAGDGAIIIKVLIVITIIIRALSSMQLLVH